MNALLDLTSHLALGFQSLSDGRKPQLQSKSYALKDEYCVHKLSIESERRPSKVVFLTSVITIEGLTPRLRTIAMATNTDCRGTHGCDVQDLIVLRVNFAVFDEFCLYNPEIRRMPYNLLQLLVIRFEPVRSV